MRRLAFLPSCLRRLLQLSVLAESSTHAFADRATPYIAPPSPSLLFRSYNHGGVVLYDVPEVSNDGAPTAMEMTLAKARELDELSVEARADMSAISIKMNWNLASFLPTQARNDFEVLVGEYIYKCLLWRRERGRKLVAVERGDYAGSDRRSGGEEQPAAPRSLDEKMALREEIEVEEKKNIRSFVSETLLRKMMDLIPKMLHQEANVGATAFPVRAGSHLTPGTPALELVKSVCATLMLDDDARAQVRLLKSHLIRLVNVREFSKESVRRILSTGALFLHRICPPRLAAAHVRARACTTNRSPTRALASQEWRDPCLSFVLPDVICSFCNQWRDLDLCRDAAVTGEHDEEEEDEAALEGTRIWKCASCEQPYDMDMLEHSLVAIVQRRSTWFQLQDLRSVKTVR